MPVHRASFCAFSPSELHEGDTKPPVPHLPEQVTCAHRWASRAFASSPSFTQRFIEEEHAFRLAQGQGRDLLEARRGIKEKLRAGS